MIVRSNRRKAWAALAACACFACPALSRGGVTFSGASTAKWTFDADTSSSADPIFTLNVNPPPVSTSMPTPPAYQINRTYTSGASSSVAKGSIGYIANPTTATFTLASGTGVTQNDPNNAVLKGDSSLRVDFDGLFTATSPSFGPAATGYVSVGVGGTVGAGGSASFQGTIQFLDNNGVKLRPDVVFTKTVFNTAGPFSKVFTSSSGLNSPTLTLGTNVPFHVKGNFIFTASNEGGPSEILPNNVDMGGAAPTATSYLTGNTSWNSGPTWAAPENSFVEDLGLNPGFGGGEGGGEGEGSFLTSSPNSFLPWCNPPSIPTIPNGVGQRARIVDTGNSDHSITLDSTVTLGALEINTGGNLKIKGVDGAGLIMEVEDGNASIVAHSDKGKKTHHIDAPITLNNQLDLFTDGTYNAGNPDDPNADIAFDMPIGGENGIHKMGKGHASLNAHNTFTGGTDIDGGELDANAEGSLGDGFVNVHNGKLNYKAKHAAATGIQVQSFDGGIISFGVTPDADESFQIGGLSGISGNAAVLSGLKIIPAPVTDPDTLIALTTSSPANAKKPNKNKNSTGFGIVLSPGAIIAHEDFDPNANKGNPQGLDKKTPLYIFGIANDFVTTTVAHSMQVGSESNSPWIGFGNDGIERTFGSSPTAHDDKLQIRGNAQLVSPGETLYLNAILQAVGSHANTAVLNKVGKGTVAIQNIANDYHGVINVLEGQLLVNGNLPSLKSMNVADGASLGGVGNIGGPVNVAGGGKISPGGNKAADHVGTLHTGPLTLNSLAELDYELGDPGVVDSGVNDFIDISGNLSLAGILDITDLGGFGPGTYTLMHFTGTESGPGLTVDEVPDSSLFYTVSVVGQDVLLNVTTLAPLTVQSSSLALIPEPASAAVMLFLGSAGLIRRRRRAR